jgi:hypothetical protein
MTDEITPVAGQHGVIGYLITYGSDRAIIEAFNAQGDLLGAFNSKAQAAAEVARVLMGGVEN